MPAWFISSIVHFLGIIILALITIAPPPVNEKIQAYAPPVEQVEEIKDFEIKTIPIDLTLVSNSVAPADASATIIAGSAEETETVSVIPDVDQAPSRFEISEFGNEVAPKSDLATCLQAIQGTGLMGRGDKSRAAVGIPRGMNKASEAAVARALKWLAAHQNADGSWSFDHRTGPCNGRCGNAGNLSDCRTGATAMALLPFLGAGQTHREGHYKEVLRRGLYFLTTQMKLENHGGLQTGNLAQGGGQLYSHGLAAITLCEAYGMTQDKSLMAPAQLSLNHIMYAQDPVGGGWRYEPRQAGDTSVVGWQLMALKSGHMAYLRVDPKTIHGAVHFLDTVGVDSGSYYGYTDPGKGQATTAVGLLSRMYLGWKKDNPALQRGIDYLATTGPSKTNLYYDYYATQVLCQNEGEKWDKWNVQMRDWLVAAQNSAGHQTGSWHIPGDIGADRGGRLYSTSLSTMILEVYYRHMPLYGKQAAEDDFPLGP
ncbi:MAG: terpene cyclase/mutase family protein [Pirellulaceae bacterium]|nr:terpene cyclase/mutase family protein [Pirellulaceae bacterium]